MPEFIVDGESRLSTRTPEGVLNPVIIDRAGHRVRFREPSAFRVMEACSAAFAALYGPLIAEREKRLNGSLTVARRIAWLSLALLLPGVAKPRPAGRPAGEAARRIYARLTAFPWQGLMDVEAAARERDVARVKAELARKEAARVRNAGGSYDAYIAADRAALAAMKSAKESLEWQKRYHAQQRKDREAGIGWATIGERWDRPNATGLRELQFLLTGRMP